MIRFTPIRVATIRTAAIVVSAALLTQGLPGHVAPAAAVNPGPVQIVRFDDVKYGTTACPHVTVQRAAPQDPAPDSLLQIATASDSENVALTQTGPDTWTASVCGQPGPIQSGDGLLQVAPGDHLLAASRTAGSPSGVDTATVTGGGSGNGTVSVTLNPQPFPPVPPTLRSITNPMYASGVGPKKLHNARLTQPDGSVVYFASDQVLLREQAPGDLAAFLARHPNSVVLNSVTLDDVGDSPGAPPQPVTWHDVYVDARKYSPADAPAQLEQAAASGTFEFTSKAAMNLYALLLDEQVGGTQVVPNTIGLRNSVPASNEAVKSPNRTELFNEPTNNKWYQGSNPIAKRVGAAQTLALLDVMKQDQQPKTKVAIVDGGFASPTDYGNGVTPPDYGAPNDDYNQIPQCSANMLGVLSCGPGTAGGSNPSPCGGQFGVCKWHGAEMVAAAAGRINNGGPATDGGGSGGIGGYTTDVMLFKADWSYFLPLATSISSAAGAGAKVISISSGFPCMQFIDLCDEGLRQATKVLVSALCFLGGIALGLACAVVLDLLDLFANVPALFLAINGAVKNGVVVVAAAGNDGKDAGSEKVVPCVWPDVVCVGGLDLISNDLVAGVWNSQGSAFGAPLSLWAPGTGVGVFETPKPKATKVDGTSPATAFTSGVVSIIRSIAPNLSGLQVRQLLADAGCKTGHTARINGSNCIPSTDPRVDANGYLDVLDALHRARAAANLPSLTRCSGGWDQLVAPNDNPALPRDIPGVPFTWSPSGQLGQWSDDATVKRPSFTVDGQPDGQWYSVKFNPNTIPQNAPPALNIKLQLRVPDPSLGALTMEVFAITTPGYGNNPPVLKKDTPFNLVDTTTGGGTGEWDGYMSVHKDYLVHVIATTPESQNANCFDQLTVTSMEGFGNPPPKEAGLELGIGHVIAGRNPPKMAGSSNTLLVPVTLTQAAPFPVTATWETYDIASSAVAGVDYTATSGSFTIPSGQTSTQLSVPIATTKKTQGILGFGVRLTSSNAPSYIGNTYALIDPPPTKGVNPIVEVASSRVYEGDVGAPRAIAIAQLDRPATQNVVVQYTLTSTDATLLADWNGGNGTVVIPKGQTNAVIHFSLLGDTHPENAEHVTVTLTNVSGPADLGSRSADDVTILDDDDY